MHNNLWCIVAATATGEQKQQRCCEIIKLSFQWNFLIILGALATHCPTGALYISANTNNTVAINKETFNDTKTAKLF
ncbi:hypothetical protein GCM10027181_07060 [Rheinheimera gaetbuli]